MVFEFVVLANSNWKELLLAIFVVASGVGNAYFWKQLIFSGNYADITLFSVPILLLFIFAASFSLLALFGKSGWLSYGGAGAAFVGSFFFIQANSASLLILVLTLLGAFWALKRIRHEAASSVSVRLGKMLRHGLPLFFTAVALMISVFYFSNIVRKDEQVFVPRVFFELSLPYLQGTLQGLLPGFRADASVNELLLDSIRAQLGDAVDVDALSPGQIEVLIGEQRRALAEGLGLNLSGDERAGDVLYKLTNQQIEQFVGPYKEYIPYLSAFGFFLAIKVLTLPLYFITLGLVWIVVQFLLAAGAIKRETVSMQVERISL